MRAWRWRQPPDEGETQRWQEEYIVSGGRGVSPHTFHGQSIRFLDGLREGLQGNRKKNGKDSAALGAIAAGNLAVVLLDNAVTGAEAEAGSLPHRFRSVEGFEDTLGFFDAWPGVRKFHLKLGP